MTYQTVCDGPNCGAVLKTNYWRLDLLDEVRAFETAPEPSREFCDLVCLNGWITLRFEQKAVT